MCEPKHVPLGRTVVRAPVQGNAPVREEEAFYIMAILGCEGLRWSRFSP